MTTTTEVTTEAEPAAPRVIVLVATIPPRKRSCERLLAALMSQSRRPDGVVLVLDGYGEAPAPACPLPIIATYRTGAPSGPGGRWKAACELPAEDIVICLDDDVVLQAAPHLVKKLSAAIESGADAAAAMGRSPDGKSAPPGDRSRGSLIHAAGCGFTMRAGLLAGLQDFAADVRAKGGPDALGLYGDDDALVSAFLWQSKVLIVHAATGNIHAAPGTHATSQTAAHVARREDPNAQKLAIKKITGWPWPDPNKKVPSVRRA